MSTILVFFITVYQRTLSLDHSWFRGRFPFGYCRHYPTCSEYARGSILKYGAYKGVMLGLVRIIRCNPFSEPQVDPVH